MSNVLIDCATPAKAIPSAPNEKRIASPQLVEIPRRFGSRKPDPSVTRRGARRGLSLFFRLSPSLFRRTVIGFQMGMAGLESRNQLRARQSHSIYRRVPHLAQSRSTPRGADWQLAMGLGL